MPDERKVRVLAVDDSLVTLKILKKTLKNTEFEIVGEASTADDALAKFEEIKPDLVLLDIIMPEVDGIQILGQILQKDSKARVVMVSSIGAKEKVEESLDKGAKSFVMKPYDQKTLLEVLKDVYLYLFNMDIKYKTDLDKIQISEGLREEFQKNGFALSQNVTVEMNKDKDSEWAIKDDKNKYKVKKIGNKLNIYAY